MKKFKLPEKIAELHEHIWRILMDDVVFSSISLKQAKKNVKFYNIFNAICILAKSFRKAKFGWFGISKASWSWQSCSTCVIFCVVLFPLCSQKISIVEIEPLWIMLQF